MSIQADYKLQNSEHQILGLPRPSNEPITFPCQVDALCAIPQTQVLIVFYMYNVYMYVHNSTL